MADLVRWLTAQLDEDERIARAATAGPWRAHDTHLGQYGYAATVLSGEGNDTDLRAWLPSMSNEPWDEKRNVWADAAHIAEHDPARVLREIEAKRKALDHYTELQRLAKGGVAIYRAAAGAVGVQIQIMALAYADRPGYQEAWRPEHLD